MTTLTLLKPGTEIPLLVYALDDREATYLAALALVAGIDDHLKAGTCYYRTKAGTLLAALDEVIRAILADDLVIGEASKVGPMTAEDYRRIMRPIYRQQQRRLRLKRKLQLAT